MEDRSKFIGGSDIAKIMNVSKYGDAFSLYHDKKNWANRVETNEAKELTRGKLLEPIVMKYYENVILPNYQICKSSSVDLKSYFCSHYKYKFLCATIDGMVFGINEETPLDNDISPLFGVDIKTVGKYAGKNEWGNPGTDEVPIDYKHQVNWYCGIACKKAWEVVAAFGIDDNDIEFASYGFDSAYAEFLLRVKDGRYRVETYRVNFDKELFHQQVSAALNFWHNLQDGIEPEPSFKSKNDLAVIKDVYKSVDNSTADAPNDYVSLADEYMALAKQKEFANKILKDLSDKQEAIMAKLLYCAKTSSTLNIGNKYKLERKLINKSGTEPSQYIKPTLQEIK